MTDDQVPKFMNPGRRRAYASWNGMFYQCQERSRYRPHGIKWQPDWDDFENFYADMGARPKDTVLTRIDKKKSYSKENCIYAPLSVAMKGRWWNRMVRYQSRTQNIFDWSRELNLNHLTLLSRLRRGWSVEKAFTTPAGRCKCYLDKKAA